MSVCRSSLYSASHPTSKWTDQGYRMKRKGTFCASVDRDVFLLDLSFFFPSILPRSLPVYHSHIISTNIDFPSVSYLPVSFMCPRILVALSFMAHRNAVGVIGFRIRPCSYAYYCYSFERVAFRCAKRVRRREYDCVSCVTNWEGSI